MKIMNNSKELQPSFVNEMVNDGRPRKVVQWVDHFMSCTTCRKPGTEFPAQAKTRSELCSEGRKRLDVWLDEE